MGFELNLFRRILAVVLTEPTGLIQDPDHKTGTHIIYLFIYLFYFFFFTLDVGPVISPLTELVQCVTVAFTNLLLFNYDFSFEKNQKSQGAKSGL